MTQKKRMRETSGKTVSDTSELKCLRCSTYLQGYHVFALVSSGYANAGGQSYKYLHHTKNQWEALLFPQY